jgi:biotin carboxylase
VVPPDARESFRPDGLDFPVVCKPAARRSSSGVRLITDPADLPAGFGEYLPGETVVVERYVAGQEYSVEALVQDGRPIFESVTLKQTNESGTDRFVELCHSVPAPRDERYDQLLTANRRVLELLEFRDGVVHTELRHNGERVYLMEVAARTPGDGLLPLYHLATGEPMEPQIVRIALGEPARYPAPQRYARQVYLDHPLGVLHDVEVRWPNIRPRWVGADGDWPVMVPGGRDDCAALRAVLVLKTRGTRLGALRESDDRAVTFLVDAPSRKELDLVEDKAREAVRVEVTP